MLERLGYRPDFRRAYADASEKMMPAHYDRTLDAYEATLVVASEFD